MIGLDSPVTGDKQSGSSPAQKMTKVTDGVASLQVSAGGDGKPPKPPKKTQFASSFNELKQVHRSARTNSSRNGTSEGRHVAQ